MERPYNSNGYRNYVLFSEKSTQKTQKGDKKPMWGAIATILTGLISAGVSIWQHIEGKKQAEEQYNREFDFNTETRNTTWEREDNQLQRAKEDAVAAGFSPLVAAGNTASGGGTVSAPSSNASQSPIDLSGILGIMTDLMNQNNQVKMQTNQLNAQKEMQEEQIESNERIAEMQSNTTKSEGEATRTQSESEFARDLEQRQKEFSENTEYNNKALAYQNAMLTEQTNARTQQEKYEYATLQNEWYKQHKVDGAPMGKKCTTWSEYDAELKTWQTEADNFLKTLKVETTDETAGTTQNGGFKGGIKLFEALEIGGDKTTQSTATKRNTSSNEWSIEKRWEYWLKTHPQPIPPVPEEWKKAS